MSNDGGTGARAASRAKTPQGTGAPTPPQGAALLGLAGGMLVVAGGLFAGYFVIGDRGVADAATTPATAAEVPAPAATGPVPASLQALLGREVAVKTATGTTKLTWAELGVEIDPEEATRAGGADIAALASRGSLPVRLDREKAVKALAALKVKTDQNPVNAYLDLEAKKIFDDKPGQGLDVWGSLPRLAAAVRQGAQTVELAMIPVPAVVTKAGLGIDDISNVLGHYETQFSVVDRDRNFNLKLAASKINGVVLRPGQEWSFNGQVGERSQKMGYKVAHVIEAGEMVDGLAGGTCQISTTVFGAAFFAGLDIVKTTNHSRPSAYTPLAFDATVVWPTTDLVLKNSYDFPVAIRYVVANGEAKVEVLGKKRPYDKVVFEREITEETPFDTEERLDEEIKEGEITTDQEGFNGYKLDRFRKFYKGGKLMKKDKWVVTYKPVTEYIRRGTNPDPDAKVPKPKASHGPRKPNGAKFQMQQ
ncbi:MAG TPA: VanW family protein [Kofleriaceae bacterium]|nr:VanW family protein [Kofleriaceae bacterium]